MPSLARTALRLLRQLLGSPTSNRADDSGTLLTLDGHSAVAILEAGISSAAGLGASARADGADQVWRVERQRRGGDNLGGRPAGGTRAALATAIGQSLAGNRATAFISADDLAAVQDLLASARGRHVPLVLHVSNQALAGHSSALGSGHEALHVSADSGCFLLFAANVQEAVDFTLVARRVAEQTLIPGLVIMDGEQTALALQDVRLPDDGLLRSYLGDPDDALASPTPAQKMLFGEQRRRVPAWYNSDRPVRLGGIQAPAVWGLGRAADHVFIGQNLAQTLEQAFAGLATSTGRRHHAVSAFRVEDATVLLVAQGAAIETAEAVANHLRSTHKLKLGVLGLRSLRPIPGARIAELLQGKAQAIVLERIDTPCAGSPPLLRELQATLQQSLQQSGFSSGNGDDYPSLTQTECPRLRSAIYGLGGLPLRAADLMALCTDDEAGRDRPVYLGVRFADVDSQYPKRQVLLDRLRRDYPDIARRGLRGEFADTDLRPVDALSMAVHRVSGLDGEGLAQEIACFLQRATGGQIRSHPDLVAQPFGGTGVDRFTCAAEGLRDPGAQMPIDLALLTAAALRLGMDPLTDLHDGGLLLVEDTGAGTQWPGQLTSSLQGDKVGLYRIAAFATLANLPTLSDNANTDYLLGAVFGVMLDAELLDLSSRRVLSLREQALQRLPAAEREARLDGFRLGLERVHRLDVASVEAAQDSATRSPDEIPLVVRRLGQTGDSYDSLPRFWDQVGVLYRDGATDELTPDPYLSSGVTPSLSTAFRDLSPLRETLPALDPLLCTGCGDCWSRCPDGAVGALALNPTSVLETAIGHTGGADALRPLAGKLAAQIVDQCATASNENRMFAELLQGAWAWLQERMPLPAERGQRIGTAVETLCKATDGLPVVTAEPFSPHDAQAAPGDAALLFLAINPDACKGCGICVASCEPGALSGATQTRRSLREARHRWRQWEKLPDTDHATLERIGAHTQPGPLATTLLARRHIDSLAGGDAAEPGSGERLAVRLAMAVAESRQRPALDRLVREVGELREKISVLIRETLADALPADDLDALERGLDTVESRQAELGTLIASVEQSLGGGIDIPRLRRYVQLARDLGELNWRLTEGPLGIGRARLGLVLSADAIAEWSGTFPDNPFATPVVVDLTGDALAMSVGLLQGQLRQSTEAFRMLRRARHELEQAQAPHASGGATPQALGWDQLSAQEREVCPPLLVIGGDGLLRGNGLSQMDLLLKSDLPIRLIVLNQAGLELPAQDAPDAALGGTDDLDLALLALTRRHTFVAQTSISAPDHLTDCLRGALDAVGPALLHLHAPSPSRHGFATNQTVTRAQQAVAARVFPLFRYDPRVAGVFGSRFNLEGNPEPLSHWSDDDASAPTPASWALGESRFSGCFTPLSGEDPDPLPVDEYLALDEAVRTLKTPVVSARGEDGSTVRFKVAASLLRVCEQRQAAWQVLQEISGLVTPFTERVEQAARDQVAADHESELAALRSEYESRIAALEGEMLEKTRQAMRQRMMQLAGYSSGNSEGGNPN